MRFIHFAIAIAMAVAILAQPLRGATWYIAVKPGMEVIDWFWLPPGGHVEVLVDTREQCLKLNETTEPIPADLVRVATVKTSQTVIDGKSVPVVTISISKEEIAEGFKAQKYKFRKGKFELKEVKAIERPL